MKYLRAFFICAVLCSASLAAETRSNVIDPTADPRGEPDVTICSQNLENFGSYEDSKVRNPGLSSDDFQQKELALARRIASKGCDIVAVQEVLGKDDDKALAALKELTSTLKRITNRVYEARVGPTLDKFSHVGFLTAVDRVEVMNHLSYAKVELPKLLANEKPRLFIRAPFEIQVSVRAPGGPAKSISLINFHFKSRRGSSGDPAELEWETYRMAMAEAIRRIAELRHARAFSSGESMLVLLGDRNSHFDCASARILEGSLVLKQFQEGGVCRLSKRGVPLCQAGSNLPAKLFSVLTSDPQTKLLPGTEQFKEEYSWLDDILMPSESLRYAWERFDTGGDYNSGVVYTDRHASDHAMVWVKLNW